MDPVKVTTSSTDNTVTGNDTKTNGETTPQPEPEPKLQAQTQRPAPTPLSPQLREYLECLRHRIWFMKEKERRAFSKDELYLVMVLARNQFESEPPLVTAGGNTAIIGAINGSFVDLMRSHHMNMEEDGTYKVRHFVHLGNYVGKGEKSLETVMYLFIMKILYPQLIVLLRGSNETTKSGCINGFYDELTSRYSQGLADQIFVRMNKVFNHMPLCAIIGDQLLAMHAGICPEMASREVLMQIPKPLSDPSTDVIAISLLMSDPMYHEPAHRTRDHGQGIYFGEALLDQVCENLGVRFVFRGHEIPPNGFELFGTEHLLCTVHSVPSLTEEKTMFGATVWISDAIQFKVMFPIQPGRDRDDKEGQMEDFRRIYDQNLVDTIHAFNPDYVKERDRKPTFWETIFGKKNKFLKKEKNEKKSKKKKDERVKK